ncbi:MAG: hypothetical protein RL095_3596 [Verrucomicrobiota bacterium]|jgi:hypothetical protein
MSVRKLWILILAGLIGGHVVIAADAPVPPTPEQGSVDSAGHFTPAGLNRELGKASPEQLAALAKLKQAVSGKNPGERVMAIGDVICDFDKRRIRFPARLNMIHGELEYVLVASNGKLHESLFSTEVSPEQIHLAALLLGLEEKALPERFDDKWAAQKLSVTVSWERNGGSTSIELSKLYIRGARTSGAVPAASPEPPRSGACYYHGSRFFKAGFAAQVEGSILGLTRDPSALMNADVGTGPDLIYTPNSAQLPRLGSRVDVTLSLPVKP